MNFKYTKTSSETFIVAIGPKPLLNPCLRTGNLKGMRLPVQVSGVCASLRLTLRAACRTHMRPRVSSSSRTPLGAVQQAQGVTAALLLLLLLLLD